MEINERKNYIGYAVIIFIYAMLVLCSAGYVWGRLFPQEKTETASTEEEDTIEIDWASLYPFETEINNDEDFEEIAIDDSSEQDTTNSVFDKINHYLQFIPDLNILVYFPKYDETITLCRNFIVKKWTRVPQSSNYALTNDGYIFIIQSKSSDEALKATADGIADLSNFCDEQGIPFLYMLCPNKATSEEEEAVGSYTNENNDRLSSLLKEQGVDLLDMRDLLEEQGLDRHSLFYRTDHHWNMETGLWAAGELVDILNENYSFNLDTTFYDENLYESKVYENAMFGSEGHGLGHAYADSEDFEILLPTFDTSFRLLIANKGIDETGTFATVMYDEEQLLSMQNEGGSYVFGTLIGGGQPLKRIDNLNNSDGIKILMICDSFSRAVAPYLAFSANEIDLIDVRNGLFTGSIRSFIKQEQPDIVIMPYYIAPEGYTYE